MRPEVGDLTKETEKSQLPAQWEKRARQGNKADLGQWAGTWKTGLWNFSSTFITGDKWVQRAVKKDRKMGRWGELLRFSSLTLMLAPPIPRKKGQRASMRKVPQALGGMVGESLQPACGCPSEGAQHEGQLSSLGATKLNDCEILLKDKQMGNSKYRNRPKQNNFL